MNLQFLKFLICALILPNIIFAQSANKGYVKKDKLKFRAYSEKLKNQEIFITECETRIKEMQLKNLGRTLPKISGECEWTNNGCPIILPRPIYPEFARINNIFGFVEVEIIVDETGKTVYSKAVKGNRFLFSTSRQAASHSRFFPKIVCGKAVLQKRIIRYRFIPQ